MSPRYFSAPIARRIAATATAGVLALSLAAASATTAASADPVGPTARAGQTRASVNLFWTRHFERTGPATYGLVISAHAQQFGSDSGSITFMLKKSMDGVKWTTVTSKTVSGAEDRYGGLSANLSYTPVAMAYYRLYAGDTYQDAGRFVPDRAAAAGPRPNRAVRVDYPSSGWTLRYPRGTDATLVVSSDYMPTISNGKVSTYVWLNSAVSTGALPKSTFRLGRIDPKGVFHAYKVASNPMSRVWDKTANEYVEQRGWPTAAEIGDTWFGWKVSSSDAHFVRDIARGAKVALEVTENVRTWGVVPLQATPISRYWYLVAPKP